MLIIVSRQSGISEFIYFLDLPLKSEYYCVYSNIYCSENLILLFVFLLCKSLIYCSNKYSPSFFNYMKRPLKMFNGVICQKLNVKYMFQSFILNYSFSRRSTAPSSQIFLPLIPYIVWEDMILEEDDWLDCILLKYININFSFSFL